MAFTAQPLSDANTSTDRSSPANATFVGDVISSPVQSSSVVSTELNLASLVRSTGATVNFTNTGGVLGSIGSNPQILLTSAPTLSNGLLGGGFIVNGGTVLVQADTAIRDPDYRKAGSTDPYLSHAALWRSGRLTDLGALPGNNSSSVFFVNARGDAVGATARPLESCASRSCPGSHAC